MQVGYALDQEIRRLKTKYKLDERVITASSFFLHKTLPSSIMSSIADSIQTKCLAFGDRIIKLNDYLLNEAANAINTI